MLNALDEIIAALNDTNAGWVARRDAAEALGELARKSLAALRARADEKDTDVRAAVERALATIAVPDAPAGGDGEGEERNAPPTMKALALACVKKPKRAVRRDENGFTVRVQMKDDRTQDVQVVRYTRDDGRELIRITTDCGPADSETIGWAVRNNGQFMYCAFTVEEREGTEHLRIVKNFDMKHVTPGLVRDAVKEMAHYGDWMEKKLTGKDDR